MGRIRCRMTAGWVGLCLACGRCEERQDLPVRAGVSAAGGRSGGAPGRRIHWARSDDGGLGLTIQKDDPEAPKL